MVKREGEKSTHGDEGKRFLGFFFLKLLFFCCYFFFCFVIFFCVFLMWIFKWRILIYCFDYITRRAVGFAFASSGRYTQWWRRGKGVINCCRLLWLVVYLGRDDFFFFRLKKQQHFVSSTTSTSGCAVIGVCEWPPVGSSPPNSPLVDETTWTDPWRSAGVSVPPSKPPGPADVPADAADAFIPSAQPDLFAGPLGCNSNEKDKKNQNELKLISKQYLG